MSDFLMLEGPKKKRMAKTGFEVFDTHRFLVNDLEMGFIFLLISNRSLACRAVVHDSCGCEFLEVSFEA